MGRARAGREGPSGVPGVALAPTGPPPRSVPRDGEPLQVLLGAHSLSQPEPSKRLYSVRRAVPHPDSHANTTEHDLLLLQVRRPASPAPCPTRRRLRGRSALTSSLPAPQLAEKALLGPAVRTLPWQRQDRDVAPDTLCDVAGWGVDSHAGRRPDLLKHVQLPVLNRTVCNLRVHHDGAVSERMMCAESQRRKDSCRVRGAGSPAGFGGVRAAGPPEAGAG